MQVFPYNKVLLLFTSLSLSLSLSEPGSMRYGTQLDNSMLEEKTVVHILAYNEMTHSIFTICEPVSHFDHSSFHLMIFFFNFLGFFF